MGETDFKEVVVKSNHLSIPLETETDVLARAHFVHSPLFMSSVHRPPLRRIRFTELTDGIVFGSQMRCDSNWSRISQANMPGFSCLKRRIFFTTVGVATCCLCDVVYCVSCSSVCVRNNNG